MNQTVSSALQKMLHMLYDTDVLSEQTIIKWHSNVPQGVDDIQDRNALRKQVVVTSSIYGGLGMYQSFIQKTGSYQVFTGMRNDS